MSVCVAFLVSQQVESELSDVCLDVLNLLEDTLVKNNQKENEARVFYLKMTGDYYRYLAEFVTDKQYEQKAADYYKVSQSRKLSLRAHSASSVRRARRVCATTGPVSYVS